MSLSIQIQILSSWACHNGLTLSQRAVDAKSNEITGVPKLLRHLSSCHWVLDVVFREDDARARCGDAAQILSTLRRIALNLLKAETSKPKEPIRGKRIYAAFDPAYLESIIGLRQM